MLFFGPYFILGENANVLIHDNLDSVLVWIKILKLNDAFTFSVTEKIDQVLNGIPRASLFANYDIGLLWFYVFDIYHGYVINKIISFLFGYFGMYLLMKEHFIKSEKDKNILVGVSLCFGLLPFYSFYQTISSLPILIYSFLNIRKNRLDFYNWVIILIIPFLSSLVFTGFFIISLFVVIVIYDYWRSREINGFLLLAIGILCVFYLISHSPILYQTLISKEYTSHRVEFVVPDASVIETIYNFFYVFLKGQYHAKSLHTFIFIPISLTFIFRSLRKDLDKKIVLILFFLLISSVFYAVYFLEYISDFKRIVFDLVPIQIQRIHFLNPVFWYIAFGLTLKYCQERTFLGTWGINVIIVIQISYILVNHELIVNRELPSFQEFYAKEQFEEIDQYIGQPKHSYRIASIGLHPAISQYNGFYTLDGYFTNYPLEYKHRFRDIIKGELYKDDDLKSYFDNWGSRCYLFSSEIGRDFLNAKTKTIQDLNLDFDSFSQLGGKYIFSNYLICDKPISRLKLLKTFKHKNSQWIIHLYKVK